MKHKLDALLTYGWVRSSYTALRSLQRLGLRVGVSDASAVGMCQWSRLKSWRGRYAPPLTQPEQFIRDVIGYLELTGAHFLLPGHDETEVLAREREKLPAGVILPVAEHEKIALANDKARTLELAGGLGLPTPRRIDWQDPAGLERALGGVDFPLVVKLRRGNSAKGVFYPQDPAGAARICADLIRGYSLPPERYPIVQERVSGEGWGVSCLYWQGERLASFTHRRLREKTPTGGTSTLRESRPNLLLESYAHALLDSLGWHGLAMVEFKYDPLAQRGWFIEINPRLWGSIHLAVAAGVDFPALLYVAATQGASAARELRRPQQPGVVARWQLGEVIAAAGELKHLRFGRALKALLPGGADTLDDWFWDDPGAYFGQAAYYLAGLLRTRSLNPQSDGMLG